MTKSRHIAPARRTWTQAEVETMLRDYPHRPTWQVAQQLGRPERHLYNKAKNLGLKKSAEYLASPEACRLRPGTGVGAPWRFKPGHQSWNAGRKGVTGLHPNTVKNHFGPGNRPHTWVPVGSTRITYDGYLQRKVTDTGYAPRDWVAVHRLVWEAAYGPVPKGHRIAFRSGKPTTDPALIVPEALECITPAEVMRRNSLHTILPKPLAEIVQLRGALTRQIRRKAKKQQHAPQDTPATEASTTP